MRTRWKHDRQARSKRDNCVGAQHLVAIIQCEITEASTSFALLDMMFNWNCITELMPLSGSWPLLSKTEVPAGTVY